MRPPWEHCDHAEAWALARDARAREKAAAGTITSLCLRCGLRVGYSWGVQEPWTNKGYVRIDVTPSPPPAPSGGATQASWPGGGA